MRKYKNLDLLLQQQSGVVDKTLFGQLLINDLKQANCMIFGETLDDEPVLLAELSIQEDSLTEDNGLFQKQIEFIVAGKISSDEYPPINYTVNGANIQFYGRCSVIPQVCGVDLYLDKSYTKKPGDYVKQKFYVPVNKLFRLLR